MNCGGEYVISSPSPPATPHHHSPPAQPTTPTTRPLVVPYTEITPTGSCTVLGPALPAPNATIEAWIMRVKYPPCPPATNPPPAATPPDPAALAEQFWRTIPLPVPKPRVPPGYAITGKTAYLVTGGTVSPPPYADNTPLGLLTVQATGSYVVDWGDGTTPAWVGPFDEEGRPWPNGQITHVYEYAGTYTVTVEEEWTATWRLAGAGGTLGGLHTTAAIPGFRAEQLQAVITN